MKKVERFGFLLTQEEKYILALLAERQGGLSQAAFIRRLIWEAAKKNGLFFGDSQTASGKGAQNG